MYNYTATSTLVLYTDTNLDTQNIHWYTKHPFTRISFRYSRYTSFYRKHTATYNLHDQIKTRHEKYMIFKHILSINTMQEQPWLIICGFVGCASQCLFYYKRTFFLSLFQVINSNMPLLTTLYSAVLKIKQQIKHWCRRSWSWKKKSGGFFC